MTRVAIVAAAGIIRERLESVLNGSSSFTMTAAAPTIDGVVRDPLLASSEVILIYGRASDVGVRDIDALPPIPIIVLLRGPPAEGATSRLLTAGVRGVLPEDATSEEISAAIEAAAAGLVVLPPEQLGELARPRAAAPTTQRFGVPRSSLARPPALTPREQEILAMLAEGLPNKGIAVRLGISEHTVKTHLEAIFDKLGASTRAEAVARAVRSGLLLL